MDTGRLMHQFQTLPIFKNIGFLVGSARTQAAAEYTPQLCMEILKGIRDWKENNEGTFRGEINIIVGLTRQEEEQNWVNKITSQEGTYVDDVTGEVLPTELVRNARKEELDYFHKRPMYSKVPLKECVEETGKSPIKVRWVDHNKRTQEDPDIRSRLVAMEFNKGPMEGVFAAMPPIEAKRLLFSLFTTLREQGSEEYVLNFLDAKKAYCHARPRRQLYVELPPKMRHQVCVPNSTGACTVREMLPQPGRTPTPRY